MYLTVLHPDRIVVAHAAPIYTSNGSTNSSSLAAPGLCADWGEYWIRHRTQTLSTAHTLLITYLTFSSKRRELEDLMGLPKGTLNVADEEDAMEVGDNHKTPTPGPGEAPQRDRTGHSLPPATYTGLQSKRRPR